MLRLIPPAGWALLLVLTACAPALPGPPGARPVATRPDTLWVPKEHPPAPAAERSAALSDLPPELVARRAALTLEDARSVLIAVAPIVGAPRVVSAAGKITEALGLALAIALDELEGDLALLDKQVSR